MEPKNDFRRAPGLRMFGPVYLAALVGACVSESNGPPSGQNEGTPGTGGMTGTPTPRGSGGSSMATGGSGAPAATGGTVGQTGTGGNSSGALPCDVAAVVMSKCQTCHGKTPLYGATMSLLLAADFQASPPSRKADHVYQAAATRLHDTTDPMPPKGQPALTSTELATLDAWLAAGAPAGSGSCTASPPGTGGTGGGGPGGQVAIGVDALPCKPNYTFLAHGEGSMTAPYPVPNPTNDQYVCFNFKSPIKKGEQAIAFAPIIGDARVIHHWILYGTNTAITDGSIANNCSTGSSTFVTGWAPGGQNAVMDPDVGLVLDYQYFQLQMHYNNQKYADGADASGVAFCTTDTPRPHASGIVTLGSPLISIPPGAKGYSTTGVCRSLAADGKTPITVLSTSPHMHLLGSGFKTTHMRGTTDMGDLVNLPLGTFSFDDQRHYPLTPRREVMPGDVLTTTCIYDNPTSATVTFGEKTHDEMCFDFITVYPYDAATKSCFSLF
jgi:copper type II ascorbate-dependent monooxygenase-like protein